MLFSRKARRARILASNSKLFTTAAALGRFEPQDRLETTAWSTDDVSDGVSQDLYLRGGGDPTLSGSGLAKLADRVRAAGVKTVQGPLIYDDSFLDHVTGIPQHGISAERIGTLSALTIDSGSPGDPARSAPSARSASARGRDGGESKAAAGGRPAGRGAVGDFGSPTMADLIQDTNVPSNNSSPRCCPTPWRLMARAHPAGIAVVKSFAADQGASFNGENGSGLTRRNKASPVSVVRLLDSMIEVDETTTPASQVDQRSQRDAWIDSLAVAGRSGTLARRMRGTAARNRCHAKTGTLNEASALSGYVRRRYAFSVIQNGPGMSVYWARVAQDRFATVLAR